MFNTFGCFSLMRVSTDFREPIITLQLSLANPTTVCHEISRPFGESSNTLHVFSLVPPLQLGMSKILVFAAAGMLSKQRTGMASRFQVITLIYHNGIPTSYTSPDNWLYSLCGETTRSWSALPSSACIGMIWLCCCLETLLSLSRWNVRRKTQDAMITRLNWLIHCCCNLPYTFIFIFCLFAGEGKRWLLSVISLFKLQYKCQLQNYLPFSNFNNYKLLDII